MLYCSINGHKTTSLSITDRAFAYGDGLFTTAKISAGKVELLSEHINRLRTGSEKLGLIDCDFNALRTELELLAQQYALAVLKVVISAGSGGRGYSRIGAEQPTVVISVFDFPEHYLAWQKQGISLGISEQRLGLNPMLGGIKHLNRLEQVLLRRELDKTDFDDLLVRNVNDNVIETTCANIFWLKDDILFTSKIEYSGVAGLMRAAILAKYPQTTIKKATLAELLSAQEIFICNSVMGIVPVQLFTSLSSSSLLDIKSLQIKDVKRIQQTVLSYLV
jgi:4-amino-4-deoxychorismate lyase